MGISDLIARYILEELELENGSAMLSRSELADKFNCVPSQINYVLMTRFSPEHGYTVESRRGGSGYIRVSRVRMDRGKLFMHVVNAVGDSIDAQSAAAFLGNMQSANAITEGGRPYSGRDFDGASPQRYETKDELRAGDITLPADAGIKGRLLCISTTVIRPSQPKYTKPCLARGATAA